MKQSPSRSYVIAVVLFVVLVSASNTFAADTWNPKRTWVFFVELVTWKSSEEFEPFPAANRKDGILLDSIRRAGVPQEQIVYLRDQAATTAAVQTSFANFLQQAGPDDWVIVYF